MGSYKFRKGTNVLADAFGGTRFLTLDPDGNNDGAWSLAYKEATYSLATDDTATTLTDVGLAAGQLFLGCTAVLTEAIAGSDATGAKINVSGGGDLATFDAITQGGQAAVASATAISSATDLELTLTGGTPTNPSGGAVRIRVFYAESTSLSAS